MKLPNTLLLRDSTIKVLRATKEQQALPFVSIIRHATKYSQSSGESSEWDSEVGIIHNVTETTVNYVNLDHRNNSKPEIIESAWEWFKSSENIPFGFWLGRHRLDFTMSTILSPTARRRGKPRTLVMIQGPAPMFDFSVRWINRARIRRAQHA